MNTTTKPTYHGIDLDYRNELGQHVIVITCPTLETTVAVVNATACTCGHRIY